MSKEENIKKASELIQKKKYAEAIDALMENIKINASDAESSFALANVFHLKGEIGKAIKMFQKVLQLNPNHTDASISLSVLLNDIGKYEEAQKVFEVANRRVKRSDLQVSDDHINRKFSLKHLELAEMYASYSRLDEALYEYRKAYQLDTENFELRIKIAKLYSKKGFTAKAFEELKKLRNEHPNYNPARMALGLLFFEKGNIIEARSQWHSILTTDPSNQEARMYLRLSDSATETTL